VSAGDQFVPGRCKLSRRVSSSTAARPWRCPLRGALKKSISGLLFAGKKYPAVIHANEDGGDNSKARLIYWPLVTVALMAITALH